MQQKRIGICRRTSISAGIFFAVCLFAAGANAASAGIAGHVVINEIQVDSIAGAGGTDDDWVELYNPTAAAVNLEGWSIQKASGSGGTLVNQPLSGTIQAGGYFLVVRDGATTSQSLRDIADLLAPDAFSIANNNIVYLVNDQTAIANNLTDPNIVDFAGFGIAAYYEGTAAAPGISETKSISRVPDGEDTDQNSIDFVIRDNPTPQHSVAVSQNSIGGTVVLTVTPGTQAVKDISATGANIEFSVNSDGQAKIRYGLDSTYGSETDFSAFSENTARTISLTGLQCGTLYHYSVFAENSLGTENDSTADAVFETLPCGLMLNSLVMTKTQAKANNQYADGWEWKFNLTVWNMGETKLKMKFDAWTGPAALDAGSNMEFSSDNGATWMPIGGNGAYPAIGADISQTDLSPDDGRQVEMIVRMKVPHGTLAGYYDSNYGILTEQ